MKYHNYYIIHGWMVSGLGLTGNELLLYAVIYGFSQDGDSNYTGGLTYLQESISASRPTVIKTIKDLVEKGLIEKHSYTVNNVNFNKYSCVMKCIEEFFTGSKDSLPGGSKESLPNIILNNNKKNIINTRAGSFAFFTGDFQKIWEEEFLPLKKKKKASLTERALNSQLEKIQTLSNGDYNKALQILENTVNSGWTDFYPLKEKTFERKNTSRTNQTNHSNFNQAYTNAIRKKS